MVYYSMRNNRDRSIPKYLNLALIVIDMQTFFLKDIHKSDRQKIVKNQKEVIDLFMKNNLPIILIEYNLTPEKQQKTIRPLSKPLQNYDNVTHFIKSKSGAFHLKSLQRYILNERINAVCAMGINKTACVLESINTKTLNDKLIITGDSVIAEPRIWRKYDDEQKWFYNNTRFYNNQKKLVKKLKEIIYYNDI
jgi:isochorismate hydrolase